MVGFLLLAGCTQPAPEPTCIEDVCLAAPNSPDARYARETYGLHQITADELEDHLPRVDQGLLIWQSGITGQRSDDIMGFNLQTRDLVAVATGDSYLQSRAFVAAGRVVLTQEPLAGAPDEGRLPYLVLWNAATRESRVLDIGLEGKLDSYGFDGSWVLFTNRGDPDADANGLYAFHVDDGNLVHLYTPPPNGTYPDGSRENQLGETIADGKGYYIVQRTPPGVNNTFGENSTFSIVNVDLESGHQEVIYDGTLPIVRLDVENRWLAVEASPGTIWAMDLEDDARQFFQVTDKSGRPALGGEWLVFAEKTLTSVSTAVAYHLPTSTRHVLAASQTVPDGYPEIAFDWRTTDGQFAVFTVLRLHEHNLSSVGYDLYYFDLASLGASA